MEELLKTIWPSLTVLSVFGAGFYTVQVNQHKTAQRINELVWETVEDFVDLFEEGLIPVKILIAKIRRAREFVSGEEAARPLDAILEKTTSLLS